MIKKIGEGNTAELLCYDEGKLLKLYFDWVPLDYIEREYHATQLVSQLRGEPPAVYALITWNERKGIVMEHIHGETIMKRMRRQVWRLRRDMNQLAKFHHAMHTDTVPDGTDLPEIKERLRNGIVKNEDLSSEQKELLLQKLHALPNGRALIHFDFHPDNVMDINGTPRVIDWPNASIGHPLADAARTRMLIGRGEMLSAPKIVQILLRLFRQKGCAYYTKEYCRLAGCTQEQLLAWELPIIAARMTEPTMTAAEKKRLLLYLKERL